MICKEVKNKMVTCNICGENKTLEELQLSFRCVCKDCWDKVVLVDRKDNCVYQKDLFY